MSTHNRKLLQRRADGYCALRVFARKRRGKQSPRLLIKCGDCDNALEIYHDPEHPEDIEIGGVLASMANWCEILLPLLQPPVQAGAMPQGRWAKCSTTIIFPLQRQL